MYLQINFKQYSNMESYYDNYLHSLIGIFKYIICKYNLLCNIIL